MSTTPRPPRPTGHAPASAPGLDRDGAAAAQASSAANPPCIPSDQLFGSAREVQIDHHGMRYRLKQTALGKLILTK